MAALALFDVLKDFGKRPQPVEVAAEPEPSAPIVAAPQPQPDLSVVIAEAVAEAEATLERRLTLIHEAALETERQNHAAELDRLAKECGQDAGGLIAARLDDMETRVGDHVMAATARILGAILTEDVRKRSLESLARSIREAVRDTEAVRIQIRGPQSLFEALREALAGFAGNLDYAEAPGLDLTVAIDGNLFETRISEWSATISEALP